MRSFYAFIETIAYQYTNITHISQLYAEICTRRTSPYVRQLQHSSGNRQGMKSESWDSEPLCKRSTWNGRRAMSYTISSMEIIFLMSPDFVCKDATYFLFANGLISNEAPLKPLEQVKKATTCYRYHSNTDIGYSMQPTTEKLREM
jgi:hypothetical protein